MRRGGRGREKGDPVLSFCSTRQKARNKQLLVGEDTEQDSLLSGLRASTSLGSKRLQPTFRGLQKGWGGRKSWRNQTVRPRG